VSRAAPALAPSRRSLPRSSVMGFGSRSGGECSQVRAQPPGGNAELMDVFGILAEADPGVMTQDLGD